MLELPGVQHRAPIPMGCRIGNMLFSSAVMGMDPRTGDIPTAGPAQVALAFANVRELLTIGDATTDDVVFMNVYLDDDDLREDVNQHWLDMFPDPDDRPARHTTRSELPGVMCVQIELVAVIDDSA